MSSISNGKFKCWIWTKPPSQWKNRVVKLLQEKDTIVFNATPGFKKNKSANINEVTLQNYLIQCCRRLKLLKNFQTSLFNTKDNFLTLQLCLTRASKQTSYCATLSDVTLIHKHYVNSVQFNELNESNLTFKTALKLYEEFLTQSNAVDEWKLLKLAKENVENETNRSILLDSNFLVLGIPSNQAHLEILKFLCHDKEIYNVNLEVPLDVSFSENENDFDVKTELLSYKDFLKLLCFQETLNSDNVLQQSLTEIYVDDVFRSFLCLLINNRNELALAKVMTSPLVKMNHEGFTVLKSLARERNMPMCQTAISYITRIKLGGKSYAPPPNCLLKEYVKELTQFVEILNRLQEIVEDDSDLRVSVKRILNYLKNCALKCFEVKKIAVETAMERIQNLAIVSIELNSNLNKESDFKSNGMIGFKTLLIIREIEDEICTSQNYVNDLSSINLKEFNIQSHGTPVPSVLEFFKTPDLIEPECDLSLRNRVCKQITLPIGHQKLLAGLPWGGIDDPKPKSKPLLSPVLEQNNMVQEKNPISDQTKTPKRKRDTNTNIKRTILNEVTNQKHDSKKVKTVPLKNKNGGKTKRNAAKPLGKGQLQLTKFFGAK